ncbi:Nucleoside diphosphate kinase 6 [Aphelenchoides bicaudatus]|nr:Nucleoside diphosphate kinase 6 [Aphelenchoides bicaudatus]
MTILFIFMSTFAILKPDLVAAPPLLSRVVNSLIHSPFQVQRAARLRIKPAQAVQLYKEHEGRFYYNRLIRIICSGPAIILELDSKNVDPIKEWRRLIGPSKFIKGYGTENVDKETFRYQFGLSDVRNVAHGADSNESAQRELAIFNDQLKKCTMEKIQEWSKINSAPLDENQDEDDLIIVE